MKKILLLVAAIVLTIPATSLAQTANEGVAVWYEGELNVGYGFGGTFSLSGVSGNATYGRPFIETVHGARITPYAFVGAGLGVQYATDTEWQTAVMPVFLNLKGLYPVTKDFAPYLSVDLGYSVGLSSTGYIFSENECTLKGGFYASCGIGLSYKRLNFGLGLQHQGMKIEDLYSDIGIHASVNSFFLKIGVKF